jgi:dihydroorotase-like cyclic amidohydrolase
LGRSISQTPTKRYKGGKQIMVDLVIKNGFVCTENGVIKGGLAIKDGIIIQVGADVSLPEAGKTYDADGKIIFPGLIEPHCHLGLNHGEGDLSGLARYYNDIETESKTAAVGGITTINTTTLLDGRPMRERIEEAKRGIGRAYTDFRFYPTAYTDDHFAELDDLVKQGEVSCVKFLLGYKGEGARVFGMSDKGYSPDLIFRGFKKIAEIGKPALAMVHCEDPYIMEEVAGPIEAEEPIAYNYSDIFNRSHPGICEVMDLCKSAYIANYVGCPLYQVHISAKETVEQLEYFKAKGFDIIGETCLHYLIFAVDDPIAFNNPEWTHQAKVNPPIRTSKDRESLWDAINRGLITSLGTDHTNYNKATNAIGGSYWDATPGCGDGMSLTLSVMLSEGVNKNKISLDTLRKITSENVAKYLGIYPQKGTLSVGSDADVVIIDPHLEWVVESKKFETTHEGSLYEGMKLKGKPVATFVRGDLIAENSKIVATKPIGKSLKSTYCARPDRA